MKDFVTNESVLTVIDDMNRSQLESAQKWATATGDRSGIGQALSKAAQDREDMRRDGDRIIALMTGQGCRLPDHVTSPATYRAQQQACYAAKGAADERAICDYVSREVARLMGDGKADLATLQTTLPQKRRARPRTHNSLKASRPKSQ